ncbi:hypothetical protein [Pseudomonas hunanensis]|uniref:hypothetical protein n=1 Tax=Pseudomonas hunanensis TaxID=1247546 RepID=UPI0030D82733
MDIESFAQCLQFIEVNSAAKSSLDKYLPILTTLLGTGVGFGLNQVVTLRKEGKTKSNKVDCCYEDIHELQDICRHMLRELCTISEFLVRKTRPTGHTLHSSISLPLLDKYYPDVSHTFTVNQRYWAKLILRKLGEANELIDSLMAMREEKSLYKVSVDVINLQVSFLFLLKLSLWFIAGEQLEFSDEDEMLAELNISTSGIEAVKILKQNAEGDDSVLGLSRIRSARSKEV